MDIRVEFQHPGSFVDEYTSKSLESYDDEFEVPASAVAYRFYELPDVPESTDEYTVVPKRMNEGPWHYVEASILTTEDVEELNTNGRYDILLSNMRGNGWGKVIKTRRGTFKPYEGDEVIV